MALKIGLSGGGSTVDRMVDQLVEAEDDGFTTLWYAGALGTDPLVLIPLLGRATSRIEMGTSIVQTYPRHPVLLAQQASAVALATGADRFTLGIGVSHRPAIEGTFGYDYDANAEHLREYLEVLGPLLSDGRVSYEGRQFTARAEIRMRPDGRVPVLVAALGSKALRSAGELADGTITWMANRVAIESHVAPKIAKAAADAGKPQPRVVAGLPVAVTDDIDGGRTTAAEQFSMYGMLPNYQRILKRGAISSPAEAAIVGSEDQVATELEALVAAGATDIWAAIFPVGDDRRASRERTRNLLRDLVRG